MQLNLLKRLGKSILRIIAAFAIAFGALASGYWIWRPGRNASLPAFSDNATWLGHGWLEDDSWFRRNDRNVADFRDVDKCTALLQRLRGNGIATVYPHLCPARVRPS